MLYMVRLVLLDALAHGHSLNQTEPCVVRWDLQAMQALQGLHSMRQLHSVQCMALPAM